jgi:excisionase family DNA binding protein
VKTIHSLKASLRKRNKADKQVEGMWIVLQSPLLLTIPEVAALLGVHRSKVYTLIRRDGLPTVSLGKRGERKVYRTSLEQWIKQQESSFDV